MSLKTALVATLLMAAAVAPPAVSQPLRNVIVSGTVPCSSVAVNITLTTPVFANATVELLYGGVIVGTTVTIRNGTFSLLIDTNLTITELLNGCKLVVPTPLSLCNPSLPSNGTLQAPLQLNSSNLNLGGILRSVINLVPSIFQLVP